MSSGMPASRAIASRCRTRFVDPPLAAPPAIAFSNEARVRMRSGAQAALEELHHQLAGSHALAVLAPVEGGRARGAERGEAQELERHSHRVRRELPAAGSRARASMHLELQKVLVGHLACRVCANALEDVLDRHVVALEAAWRDGTAVDDHARNVEAHVGHGCGRKGLVAADDGDDGVEHVPAADELDRVGHDLAADEGGLHPLRCPS